MSFPGKIHFVGIGGAGMAPLAQLCLARKIRVTGSDVAPNKRTETLERAGARIHTGHAAGNLPPDTELTIYSSAVPPENPERAASRARGIPELRRGEFLARFAEEFYSRVVSVSGSHGKSSISALLVRILQKCGHTPGYLIGAVPEESPDCGTGSGDLFVCEVDESDGTHSFLHSHLALIPNIEPDHEWSVGGWEQLCANFTRYAGQAEHLVYLRGETPDALFRTHASAEALEIPDAFAGHSGFRAADAFLAWRAAVHLGCPPEEAEAAAREFPRLARRMQLRVQLPGVTVIEDYAHHPTEVAASLQWLRKAYPGTHLRVVFQPHRYARLERFFDGFVRELSRADSLLVVPVFAAWSESGRVDGAMLARAAGGEYQEGSWDLIARKALDFPQRPAVLAVLGAGDIAEIFHRLPDKGTAASSC